METAKVVSRQQVLSILKKANVAISTVAPSSSKCLRFDGVVIESCSVTGKQEFIEVPTRVKGRKGSFHNWTKKVLVEQVVRMSYHTNRFAEGEAEREIGKAIDALTALGFDVKETKVAAHTWNGVTDEIFFVVNKVGA